MNKFVNIVNFIRGAEPRHPQRDLLKTVTEEIKLNRKYGFPNTFLVQYDALCDPKYQVVLLDCLDENTEIGLWFECVRPLVEAAGLPWRGAENVTWDWHVVPGFLMAYTPAERERMISIFVEKFVEIFGFLPKTVGSWLLDSHSVEYFRETYDIQAFLICREQYGVDAYTVWGGYQNQGYYPSKQNVACPGQTAENTVFAPVFKMLGPDPIYCYDEEEFPVKAKGCATMEPVYEYGYKEEIFRANLASYYEEECMDFAYTTVGQENSFGWEAIEKGLKMQYAVVDEWRKQGKVRVEKVCDTGKWFREHIKGNSTVSLISHRDWSENGLKSVWYSCKNYRVNLFCDNGTLYFRDIHKFDETYPERYLTVPCQTPNAVYDNLPVVDGRMWNKNGIKSGLKFSAPVGEVTTRKEGNSLICTALSAAGKIKITLSQDEISIEKPAEIALFFERGREFDTSLSVEGDTVFFRHNGFDYRVRFSRPLQQTDAGYRVVDPASTVELFMN